MSIGERKGMELNIRRSIRGAVKQPGFWFAAGLATILFMAFPYLILGQDAIVTYHDQLDGELIAYLLQAKHLFAGDILPEFLGGASKTALIPPAPACVLLFMGGDGFAGLVIMQLGGSICGYLGTYLLARRVTGRSFIPAAAGVIYGYLPFLPVYGLAQYGLPMLLFLVLEVREGRHRKPAFLYAALYALTSSLVLAGFGVLFAMAVLILREAVVKKRRNGKNEKNEKNGRSLLIMWIIMLLCYIVTNSRLIIQTLGLKGMILGVENSLSHKTEYVLSSESFWEGFFTGLIRGGQHSEDFHDIFLGAAAFIAVCGLCVCRLWETGRNEKIKKLLSVTRISFGWNVFFAVTAALWNAAPGISLRRHLQVLGAFQMDRFLWLAPCFWYLILACALAMAAEMWENAAGKSKMKGKRLLAAIPGLCMGAVLCITGLKVVSESNLKPNLQKLRNPDYEAFSFRDYYAVDVMAQAADFLEEYSGLSREEFRVVSLGIDPTAALYQGFYCLDGYSNNYSLAYKHAFRRVIAPELAKSEYLTGYFDDWGNRCYLFSAECPGYYTIEKGGFFFADYSLDVEALRELGGDYLLSAAYIANAQEQGLMLLREEPFETEDSYYRIYIYGF